MLFRSDKDAPSFPESIKWSITPAKIDKVTSESYDYGEVLTIERRYNPYRDSVDETMTTKPTGLWVGERGAFVTMTSDHWSVGTPGYYELIHRGYLDKRLEDITYELATEEDAIGGTDNTSLMTPLRVEQAFDEKFKVIDGVLNVYENGEWVKYVPK